MVVVSAAALAVAFAVASAVLLLLVTRTLSFCRFVGGCCYGRCCCCYSSVNILSAWMATSTDFRSSVWVVALAVDITLSLGSERDSFSGTTLAPAMYLRYTSFVSFTSNYIVTWAFFVFCVNSSIFARSLPKSSRWSRPAQKC